MLDTLLLVPSLHCNASLHFTTLHYIYRHFTSSHLHFTTLQFALTHLHFISFYHYVFYRSIITAMVEDWTLATSKIGSEANFCCASWSRLLLGWQLEEFEIFRFCHIACQLQAPVSHVIDVAQAAMKYGTETNNLKLWLSVIIERIIRKVET